jgi:hypothetical protein
MFRNGSLDERAVVLDCARRLVDLIVQLSKIVMRGGVRWAIVNVSTAFLWPYNLTSCTEGNGRLDERVAVRGIGAKDGGKRRAHRWLRLDPECAAADSHRGGGSQRTGFTGSPDARRHSRATAGLGPHPAGRDRDRGRARQILDATCHVPPNSRGPLSPDSPVPAAGRAAMMLPVRTGTTPRELKTGRRQALLGWVAGQHPDRPISASPRRPPPQALWCPEPWACPLLRPHQLPRNPTGLASG